MYFEMKADTGSIQINDNTKFYQLVYAKRQQFYANVQNPSIQYGITGESVKKRTVYYLNPLSSDYQYQNRLIFWRNPTNTPIHIFPATFDIFVSNLYSTAFSAVPFIQGNSVAVSNCTMDVLKQLECYVFDLANVTKPCRVGIEIRNANGDIIINSAKGNRPLKLLKMGQFNHCAYGNESSRGTDFENTFTFNKQIAVNIGYRGLYNYNPPTGNIATINRDVRFVVPVLTNKSLKFTTCYQNNFCNNTDHSNTTGYYGIKDEGYYDESTGKVTAKYNSDRFTIITGSVPCNRTTYAVVDVTDYYKGGAFIY